MLKPTKKHLMVLSKIGRLMSMVDSIIIKGKLIFVLKFVKTIMSKEKMSIMIILIEMSTPQSSLKDKGTEKSIIEEME